MGSECRRPCLPQGRKGAGTSADIVGIREADRPELWEGKWIALGFVRTGE